VKEIAVGPHSRLDFGAQGYHLMLMNPLRPIESAKQIPITLRFRDGTSLTIPFEVRKSAAAHETSGLIAPPGVQETAAGRADRWRAALSDTRSLVEYRFALRVRRTAELATI
jgi:hypothetical protein